MDTVDAIAGAFATKLDLPKCTVRLVFEGTQLEAEETLAFYQVFGGATLHALPRLRGGMMQAAGADETELQLLLGEWDAAWPALEAAAAALDHRGVGREGGKWAKRAIRFVARVPLEVQDSYDEEEWYATEENVGHIWSRMIELSRLGAMLDRRTQEPDCCEAARHCSVNLSCAMTQAMVNGCRLGDVWNLKGWVDHADEEFDNHCHQYDYCFLPLEGHPEASLRMLLARCSSYCCGDIGYYQILDRLQTDVDYPHRMLERLLLLIAGLARLPCVHNAYHEMVRDASNKEDEGDAGGIARYYDSLTLRRVLYRFTTGIECEDSCGHLKPLKHPVARLMCAEMRESKAMGQPDTDAYNRGVEYAKGVRKSPL